ncbi:hypothetical protein LZG04_29450 [Saccharothrix sp. S26]|uniref:TIM-barrel domain-containing protein n=1 Tax=Saccharothrix sp. S26 TaxID=2907215 RepID=UPI001F2924C3|nr:TIM-barrel domain-containing protein [Saccharothrix sp. S26]MCE6998894.1 hypothetical protein [Saccharothrix sp. S26]
MGARGFADGFHWRDGHQVARAGAWGPDANRVHAAPTGVGDDVFDVPDERPGTGLPATRPSLADFRDDLLAWQVDDQFQLGPDLLVAPAHRLGRRSREVHLPTVARWTDRATGVLHEGGPTLVVDAPLDRIPLFVRQGAQLP